ncbi:DEgenerin Like [Caenorhabditis elegans]|nr:DEgenerin Like [Caenorhabditis elegans]CBK19480.1 DEgenerin Like [Caenorhabditis elegans]|eukprot:NP_001255410.1 DEgenerin Like [Caenorhabditis elegans]
MKGHTDFDAAIEFLDNKMPSTLSLTDSDNSHSSNDITSSQAKEISYEDEMRLFIEKTGHLVTNVFADPFDSDERKSRTEMWVEASTENLAEGGTTSDDVPTEKELELDMENNDILAESVVGTGTGELNDEKDEETVPVGLIPPVARQSTEDSILSSNVTVNSLLKSKLTINLKEASEALSEIDIADVDRFWDYLYEKDDIQKFSDELIYPIKMEIPSTSSSERSIGIALSPIKLDFAGIHVQKTGKIEKHIKMNSNEEKDRELDEPLEITDQTVETRFFELETTKNLEKINRGTTTSEHGNILIKTTASQTPVSQEVVQLVNYEPINFTKAQSDRNFDEKENMIRAFSFKLSESFYKDLKILVVERDRAKEAMDILPAKTMKELSEECNYYQTRYRVRIEQNKEKLDRRIEEVWKKLLKMPIESQEVIDFISVAHSELLTLNARRNLPDNM